MSCHEVFADFNAGSCAYHDFSLAPLAVLVDDPDSGELYFLQLLPRVALFRLTCRKAARALHFFLRRQHEK